MSKLLFSFSPTTFNESGSWFSQFRTKFFPMLCPNVKPRYFSMLNLDFFQIFFQFWIRIFPIIFAIMNLVFSIFSNFYPDFYDCFILILINVIGDSIHFCCQQWYVPPYISYWSTRLDTWYTLNLLCCWFGNFFVITSIFRNDLGVLIWKI